MRDVYLPDPLPPRWPNHGQLIVMLLGWLAAGGVLGFLAAALKDG
jgi:ABC-type uncharacterized transport system permease subunit